MDSLGTELGRFLAAQLRAGAPALGAVPSADVAELLTIDDVDELLRSRGLRTPFFRLVRDGDTLPLGDYTVDRRIGGTRYQDLIEPARVLDLIASGATLVLQGVQSYWPPVHDLAAAMADEARQPVQVNAYLSPRETRGLAVHYDTHDVVAVQVAGTKRWHVAHEPSFEAPLRFQHRDTVLPDLDPLPIGDDPLEATMEPGDLLFVPRGHAHVATTESSWSLHLTVGALSVSRWDVLQELVQRGAARPGLRRLLTDGAGAPAPDEVDAFLGEVRAWLEDADVTGAHDALLAKRRGELVAVAGPRLRDLLDLPALTDDTRLEVPPDAGVRVERDADHVRVALPDRVLTLPATFEPLLRFCLDARGAFAVRELAPFAADEARLDVVRRLVREGVLRPSAAP